MQLVNVKKLLKGSEPLGEIPDSRELLATTLHVAWPSILESFLLSLVGLIDTAMVSTLGSHAIAAVGLTTQPKYIGLAIFISLNVAVSAIVARRCGESDAQNANKVLVQALIITVLLTAIVSLVSVAFAAHQIGMNMMTISFSFGDGLSVAAIALVGQSLGAKREDLARIYGTICHRTGALFSCMICVIFVAFGRYFFLIFSRGSRFSPMAR